MIRYDDISPHDLLRYWGRGIVLLFVDDAWNPYQLSHADEDEVMLDLWVEDGSMTFGEPDPTICISLREFYEECMLHRPPLGVVQDDLDGAVYLLSWKHANGGELAKAIRAEDVQVTKLQSGFVEPKQATFAGMTYEDAFRHGMRLIRNAALKQDGPDIEQLEELRRDYHEYLNSDDDALLMNARKPNTLSLVLQYLNGKTYKLADVATKTEGVWPLRGTAWAVAAAVGVVLWNGTKKIGTLSRDTGEITLDAKDDLEQLISERLVRSLDCDRRYTCLKND